MIYYVGSLDIFSCGVYTVGLKPPRTEGSGRGQLGLGPLFPLLVLRIITITMMIMTILKITIVILIIAICFIAATIILCFIILYHDAVSSHILVCYGTMLLYHIIFKCVHI